MKKTVVIGLLLILSFFIVSSLGEDSSETPIELPLGYQGLSEEFQELARIAYAFDQEEMSLGLDTLAFALEKPEEFCLTVLLGPDNVCEEYTVTVEFGETPGFAWAGHRRDFSLGSEIITYFNDGETPVHGVVKMDDSIVLSTRIRDLSKKSQAMALAKEAYQLTLTDDLYWLAEVLMQFSYPEEDLSPLSSMDLYGNTAAANDGFLLISDIAGYHSILPYFLDEWVSGDKDFRKDADKGFVHSQPEYLISDLKAYGLIDDNHAWSEEVPPLHPALQDMLAWHLFSSEIFFQDLMMELGLY